jgi:hypothetical protein
VFACGLWSGDVWRMLDLDFSVAVDGAATPMLRFVKAQEGDFALPGVGLQARAGAEAPVVHFDAEGPLLADGGDRVLVDGPWGIYFRMGRTGTGVTVGGLPVAMDPRFGLDPYGQDRPSTQPTSPVRRFASSHRRAWRMCWDGSAGPVIGGGRRRTAVWSASRRTAIRCSTTSSRTPTRSSTPGTRTRCSRWGIWLPMTCSMDRSHGSSPSGWDGSRRARSSVHPPAHTRGRSGAPRNVSPVMRVRMTIVRGPLGIRPRPTAGPRTIPSGALSSDPHVALLRIGSCVLA